MNRTVSMIGAALVIVTVFLFAVFILLGFSFGFYLVYREYALKIDFDPLIQIFLLPGYSGFID